LGTQSLQQNETGTLDFFRKLHDDQIFAIPTSFGEASYNSFPFVSLKTVMTVSSSVGVYHNVPAANAFRVKIHPVLAKDDTHKFVISTGTNLALLTNNDNEKVLGSWLFLRYLTTTANAKFALNTGYYPVTESGINSKLYQDYIKMTGESEYNMSKINAAKVNANIYGKDINGWTRFVEPGFMGSNEIREEISTLFLTLFFGLEGVAMSSQEVIDFYYEQLSQFVECENPSGK
jgi:multiple sugar transport system substrate-binding protein